MSKFKLLVVASLLLASSGAQAAWHQARSKHFIIYANQSPRELQEFATRLEKFDQALRHVMRLQDPPMGDGNRLTVFVVPSEGIIHKLIGNKNAGGFYTPRASGPLAYVPQRSNWNDDDLKDLIFFHEYAHHLTLQDLARPYPEWLVEGLAEFASTAQFQKDGSVLLGNAANHRAYSLVHGNPLPLPTLLAGDYKELSAEKREQSVYARGWLLTHYLTFESKRRGQIGIYLGGIASGTPPLQAATAAFGDLKQLDRDLNSYLRRGSLSAYKVPASVARPGPIEVTLLTQGAAQVIPLRLRSKYGVNSNTAEPLAAEVRKIQAKYPGDELVEVTLAEAEIDAGHPEAAEAAADRALKANPRNTEALIYKGRAIAARADHAEDERRAALFDQARKAFLAANKIDSEDPEPLLEYYRSFGAEGKRPTPNAVAALHYASDLVPQDIGLRMNSASQYLRDGELKPARLALAPVAFNPHGGKLAEAARAMIAKIDQGDAQGALNAERSGSADTAASDN